MSNSTISPLISVIIPCYNHGMFIDEAVDSILQQTYQNFEIIIIDAGSDDRLTKKKLANFKKPFSSVITSDRQIFPSEARNMGLSFARGKFVVTLDADDLLEKTFIEKAVNVILKDPKIGAVSSKVMYFGFEDGFMDYMGGNLEDNIQNMGSHISALIRKSAWIEINGFDENINDGFEDWEFWIRLTKMNWTINIIPEILIYYRQKESSRVTEVFKNQVKLKDEIQKKHSDIYSHPFNYLKSIIVTDTPT